MKLKETCGFKGKKLVGFEDIETGMILVSNWKGIYRMFHNQEVESISILPSGSESEILIKGHVKSLVKENNGLGDFATELLEAFKAEPICNSFNCYCILNQCLGMNFIKRNEWEYILRWFASHRD